MPAPNDPFDPKTIDFIEILERRKEPFVKKMIVSPLVFEKIQDSFEHAKRGALSSPLYGVEIEQSVYLRGTLCVFFMSNGRVVVSGDSQKEG